MVSPHNRRQTALVACLGLIVGVLIIAGPAEAGSKYGPSYKVKKVSDGDTIKVLIKGRTERVRLIGINTPELGRDGARDQCHARKATQEMKKLVKGKRIHLKRDKRQSNRDTYGRLLRYVYTTKKLDVGKSLIKRGHGRQYTYKNKAYKNRAAYKKAERKAKKANRGLWKACSAPVPTTGPPPGSTPDGSCLIKGNISSTGEKIYHLPGQQYYDVTVITPAEGERWFCTETAAVTAGWRKSKV